MAQNNINRELKLLKEREENTCKTRHYTGHPPQMLKAKHTIEAIIPAVSQKPVRVKFEDKTLKEKMILNEEYPYHKIFLVDVLVEYIDEEPVIYKILKLNNSMNKI